FRLQAAVETGGLQLRPLEAIKAVSEEIGGGIDLVDELTHCLAAMVEDLHDCADADRDQKGDDQCRYGAPQRGLGGQQAQVSGFCNGLSQSLDRVRTDRRARSLGARHAWPPFGFRVTLSGRMCRISPNHFDWN